MLQTVTHAAMRPSRHSWRQAPPAVTRTLIILAFLVVWELAARFVVDPLFLSPPTAVIAAVAPVLQRDGVVEALLRALLELGSAFFLAVTIGLTLGLTIGLRRFAYLTLMPIVIFLFAIPQSTLLPIFTVLFGIGSSAKIAYGFSHGVFPVLVTVIAAVQKLKPSLVVAAQSMGATRLQIIRHVIVPAIIPSFFTGIRLGMAATLIGVLLAELYISQQGIGYFTKSFAIEFDPAGLFALIALLSAIAVIINEALRRIENHFSRWRQH